MPNPILIADKPFVFVGLGSLSYTVPSTGVYNIKVQSFETPVSNLVLTITQNGSTVYTSPVITPTQSAFQFRVPFLFTAADAILVNLTSSTLIDEQLNTLKTTVSVGSGL